MHMIYKRILLLFTLLTCASYHSFGQADSFSIDFRFAFDKAPLAETGFNKGGNSTYELTKCRFYISNITALNDKDEVLHVFSDAFLIDLNDSASWSIILPKMEGSTQLKFGVGIDSITNASGAFGGDLDPTNGMYWSWQSGYINIKLEGKIIGPKNKKLEYHLGGYLTPFLAYQNSSAFSFSDEMILQIDLFPFLKKAQKMRLFKSMSPSKKAVALSKVFAKQFQQID